MKKQIIVIVSLIILAFLLRFYQLGLTPPSLNWDETAHGYNAYSILKTGMDEYGYKYPSSFRSFDDYKPPVYTYLVVPSVYLFDLTNFAVRFPSALLGTFAVLFTYLMTLELFKNRKIALFAGFMLAISPWHIQFSRVAFETNSAIFLSVLGTWAFLRAIRASGIRITFWMSLSALGFAANLFMYHNARVFIPLFSIALLYLYRQKLLEIKKYLVIPLLIAIVASAVLLPIIFSVAGQTRYQGTSIFSDETPLYATSEKILDDNNSIIGRFLHNRRLVYIPTLLSNYLSHFKPSYLFFEADMDRHHAPEIGLILIFNIVFIIGGIYFLIRRNFPYKTKIIIFWWFFLAPIASSVTWGVPHSLRSEIYIPMYQVFAAVGIYSFLKYIKMKKYFALSMVFLFTLNFAFYMHQYYKHLPIEFSKSWLYGRKEATLITESLKENYDRVIVSTKLEQPHEFWLYYSKYDPQTYINEGGTVSGGFLEDRNKFDKYLFKPIEYEVQKQEANTLFVGLSSEYPSSAKLIESIYYLNGDPAIYIFE